MQGLWKEDIGGWNHKDTRRKKQTRNNTIRDKGRILLKVYGSSWRKRSKKTDEKIYRRENEMVIETPVDNTPLVKTTFAYKARVEFVSHYKEEYYSLNHNIDGEIITKEYMRWVPVRSYKTMMIYFDDNLVKKSWRDSIYYAYDLKTREPLWKIFRLKNPFARMIEITSKKITNIEVKLDWEKLEEKREKSRFSDFNSWYCKEYLYGKLLPDWKRYTLYNDGRRRKYGQKMAHSKDRMRVKTWINNRNWDTEISTHCYSKSISWWVS